MTPMGLKEFQHYSVTSISELTDSMLLNLSKSLRREYLHSLAALGLGIDADTLNVVLFENPNDVSLATYHVLKHWRNNQEDAFIAFNILCEALRKVKLSFYIHYLAEP